ncbi:SusC/RagA family TonB-linked outer membrane protein [Flavobacterium branchiophilum NBRC 15030 = ATCC 35035]|uniref:Iron complex outermembrane receptor protein n=1 Tax=Flavobacterium branchiophilum TaxID=55197 RepID=A0A543G5S9_9FLAO|nr:SusC/RagA family TonB-linked outer membrane protein [Flavobacterium branchiophilum]OXA78508.1 SusC/RagA family TonB-linked outer membrane protein [Flavobacterium branchiophilum NBRC 15030 = ATCC 35035]TQM41431.1 iron complex outermembrane receptor protein [Flavobacterium branchiophilum]
MRTIFRKLLILSLLLPFSVLAQNVLNGTVLDKKSKQPIPGVNVVVQGSSKGVSTDFDGNFKLPNVKKGDKIVFSFIGYKNTIVAYEAQVSLQVMLEEDANELKEVVVQTGYGAVKKKDATGSVTLVTSKDFNKGAIVSVDQLLAGKAAGVRITNSGGAPDADPNIRIRGGASLSAENKPLIIIDGVAISNDNPAGVSNPLSLINPNDIESFSILKDASATAIYGIRASNGVIIITTKKGSSGAAQFNYSSNISVGNVTKKVDVMTGADYARFIGEYFPSRVNSLGIQDPSNPTKRILYDTDWQDQIFRTSISTDHNFSARANLYKKIPFRASIGYNRTEGLIKTSDYQRFNYSIKLTPKLWDDHLKVDINAKGTLTDKNAVDEGGAIAGAINMDPTKPVLDPYSNKFGGYYQNTILNGNYDRLDGSSNPLALLEQRTRPERVIRILANAELEYKMHFLPELRAIVNFGIDASRSKIVEQYTNNAIASYQFNQNNSNHNTNYVFNPGVNYVENQSVTNKSMDSYFAYTKALNGFVTKVDAQAGYAYQDFRIDGTKELYRYNTTTGVRESYVDNVANPTNRYFSPTNLQSFFGRGNIDILNKYLFTATMRADATSYFKKENRWGYFPAVGIAWKVKEESFLKDLSFVQDLKIRLGWGKTGQNSISGIVGYFPSRPLFVVGTSASQYLPGINLYSAKAYNADLTWEKTTTYNAGIDFEFFKKGIVSGSFDIYKRETTDLLSQYTLPPGQGLTDQFIGNVGSTEGKGFELNLNIKLVQQDQLNIGINGNVAYNYTKVTDLNGVSQVNSPNGGIPTGTGAYIAFNAPGQQAHSAWVYQQLYDANGAAIIGAYADLNGDHQIDNNDRYYKAMRPNWTFGFGTSINYKKWDLSANFRGQIGGQTYDTRQITNGFIEHATIGTSQALNNVLNFYNGSANMLLNNLNQNMAYSDYMLQDATFLRCDNIALGYKFAKFIKSSSLRVYGAVNNAFIVTKYKGQDPENFNAIDTNFYPRPRTYTFGLSLDF